jgi:hypothetical protein
MEFVFKRYKPIIRFLVYFFTYLLLVLIFCLGGGFSLREDFLLIIGVILILQLPMSILFIQYYVHDYKSKFRFEISNDVIEAVMASQKFSYSLDQIQEIELTGTAARLRKGGVRIFWQDDFFYYRFKFKDGKSVIITSILLGGKIINEANFKRFSFKKNKTFFAFL